MGHEQTSTKLILCPNRSLLRGISKTAPQSRSLQIKRISANSCCKAPYGSTENAPIFQLTEAMAQTQFGWCGSRRRVHPPRKGAFELKLTYLAVAICWAVTASFHWSCWINMAKFYERVFGDSDPTVARNFLWLALIDIFLAVIYLYLAFKRRAIRTM